MSFRPRRLRIADFRLRIEIAQRSLMIANPQSEIRNPQSSCSGRDSNSDHALIWCLQGISLLLCQLSYRSNKNFELRISNCEDLHFVRHLDPDKFAIRNSKFPNAPVGTRTLLPDLRDLCFAIKASGAKRWRQDSNPR